MERAWTGMFRRNAVAHAHLHSHLFSYDRILSTSLLPHRIPPPLWLPDPPPPPPLSPSPHGWLLLRWLVVNNCSPSFNPLFLFQFCLIWVLFPSLSARPADFLPSTSTASRGFSFPQVAKCLPFSYSSVAISFVCRELLAYKCL